jgi:hypothetical protein
VADSYRLVVLKRLTALLEGTPLTPYDGITLPATLAGVVFRGRVAYGENDPDVLVSILESPRDLGSQHLDDGTRTELWSLAIQGWCPDDKKNPTDPLYGFADDVERRLSRVTIQSRGTGYPKYPENYMLGAAIDGNGSLITKFQIGRPSIRPPTEGVSSKAFFYLPVQVGMARISVE